MNTPVNVNLIEAVWNIKNWHDGTHKIGCVFTSGNIGVLSYATYHEKTAAYRRLVLHKHIQPIIATQVINSHINEYAGRYE